MNDQSLTLTTGLKQQQRLTPQQLQFARMLEMTAPEFEENVRNAIDEMPALEASDPAADDDDPIPSYRYYTSHGSTEDHFDPATVASNGEETLIESLARQLQMRDLTPTQKIIATNIIGNIDSNGYITRNLQAIVDDIANRHSIMTDVKAVNDVWQIIRSLDPPGIAAADLRDSLSLQLKRMRQSTTVNDAREIVDGYFDLYSHKHYDKLKNAMGISNQRLDEADRLIKRLNPKPGAAFPSDAMSGSPELRGITPDFAIDVDGDSLTLTALTRIPELSIEKTFSDETDFKSMSERDLTATVFIRRKREEARDFIRLVTMRRDTLWKVMQAIVEVQRDYFLTGDEAMLRPMILRDIADMTGLNIPVISRATASKYVSTPFGIVSLKSLFNERPKEDSDVSTRQILAALRKVIENEDPRKPLADRTLTERIQAMGYDVARRTIAKYRERLGFPVARLRKKI